jgi:hypothetical protein
MVPVGERLVIVGTELTSPGSADAPEPQPQMPALMTTAVSTAIGTNLKMAIVLMAPS